MRFPRKSGILLHPTSLPGRYGIGEIGSEARWFASRLHEMKQGLWQMLPLGPTSYGDSPYQSLSTFAGNHLLLGMDDLVRSGLLAERRAAALRGRGFPERSVDYGAVIPARMDVLKTVCRTFGKRASPSRLRSFRAFCHREAYWLEDYALYIALKDAHGGRAWVEWDEPYVVRDAAALEQARKQRATAIRHVKILQYLFHDQWHRLRNYCHKRGIRIIGDIPIFVAHDSADVWAHPELFHLDGHGHPTVVAGVPPDYFSATGQLWGNPLYRWEEHHRTHFAWWAARLRKMFEMVDIVRIDHFRGFQDYWEIPAHEKTAINGRWVPGPRDALFKALKRQLGPLPIIAEDLGIITDEVEALRDRYGFPGMRVLQFAFATDPKADDYKPHNYPAHSVVYTGTHDNDTIVGWFHGSKAGVSSTLSAREIEDERRAILQYLGTDGNEIHWDLIRLALKSRAGMAIFPLQDLMGLDSSARMNTPGKESGNWQWRFTRAMLTPEIIRRMGDLTRSSRRA